MEVKLPLNSCLFFFIYILCVCEGAGISGAPMLIQSPNLKDIPLPDSPQPPSDTSLPSSTSVAPTSVQPIAFSPAPTQARKTSLPLPKPSAFRDSDEEEEEGLNASKLIVPGCALNEDYHVAPCQHFLAKFSSIKLTAHRRLLFSTS